jgi:hypothetical protein
MAMADDVDCEMTRVAEKMRVRVVKSKAFILRGGRTIAEGKPQMWSTKNEAGEI